MSHIFPRARHIALFGLLFLLAVFTKAQTNTASGALQGTVRDSNGAVLANIEVNLENPNLTLHRTVKTQSDGTYIFSLLQPGGGYKITIEVPGFKQEVLTSLNVRVTETTVANSVLTVGDVAESVSVNADEQQVQTTSATLGSVVSARVLISLPLPTRNVFDLMATDAGVAATLTSPSSTILQGANAIFVGGSRATSNNYLLNGVDANNFEFQTLAAGVVPIPDPDAVQEFRTETSLYDATSGYSSGGNLALVTRGGTNSYHGAAYEFVRNTIFNANDFFFNRQNKPRPILQQNQFGGSFSGRVPKLGDTFFFVNYEAMRQKNGITGSITGSQPVFPTTRDAASLATAFSLPVSAIDPVAVRLLNAPGSYNGQLFPSGVGTVGTLGTFAFSSPVILNTNQVSSRLDHEFKLGGQTNHLTGTGFFSGGKFTSPGGAGSSLGQPYYYPISSQSATINDTHIFSPNLLNDLVYGYNWDQRDIENLGGLTLADVGMTRSNASVTNLLPNFTFTNTLGGGGYSTNVQHPQHAASFDFRDTLTYIHSVHSFRAGFEARREQFNDGIYLPRGALTFSGGATGNASALYGVTSSNLAIRDFLIGAPEGISYLSGINRLDFRAHDYIAFLQDDYRVTSRFTVNLGLRYDRLGNPVEIKNLISNFDPSLLSPATLAAGGDGLKAGFVVPGQNGISRDTMLGTNYGSFSPRIGFASDLLGNGRLAVRGGFGLYYQATGYALQLANSGNPPYQVAVNNTSVAGVTGLANPFPALPLPNAFPIYPTFPALTGLTGTGAPRYTQPALAVSAIDRHIKSPYTENYNLNVKGEFLPHWTLEVGYVGSHGLRQTANLQLNNALLASTTHLGLSGTTSNSAANRDARVPIAGLSSTGFAYLTNRAQSNYNALAVTLLHNFARSFFVKAAYTHSKSIDNYQADASTNYAGSAVGNPYSLELNRGVSEQDYPHRFVVTYVWDLPGFKRGVLGYALGHWSVSGITTYQSGAAGVITRSASNTSLSGTAGYATLVPGCKLVASGSVKDHIGNYLNENCVSVPTLGAGTTVSGLTPYQTAGTDSFPISGAGSLVGASTRGVFHAPFQRRWDMTLSKNFPAPFFGKEGNVEFRTEAFKLFNNPIFAAPISAATNAAPTANTASDPFGQIQSTTDNTGRQLQFALKLSF